MQIPQNADVIFQSIQLSGYSVSGKKVNLERKWVKYSTNFLRGSEFINGKTDYTDLTGPGVFDALLLGITK